MFEIIDGTTEDTTADRVDDFQRVASGGSFLVTEDIVEEDVPPGKIWDLAVEDVRPGEYLTLLVELTWTWPGAHLTSGMDSGQEIGVSKHDAGLEVDFGNQTVITEADVVEGNLDPLSSSDRHITTLSLPRTFSSLGQDGSLNWHTDLTAQVANSEGLKFERGASVLRTSACDDSSRYHHESLNDHKGHKGRHNGSYRDDANC
ncbi:uncharacterized protein LOC144107639 [Amblyomma americanum]